MATARKWSNVSVAMQSAIASATTITAISTAGQVTSTGHGYANGDYVLLEVQGMYQVNQRIYRVAGSAANTYNLEDTSGGTGISTVGYGTFTSGTAKKITYGTTITTYTTLSASGGDVTFIDTTTIHDSTAQQIVGTTNPISYQFDNIWDISDAGLIAMKAAYDAQADRAFKFTFGAGGQIMVFNGTVAAALAPGGTAQGLVTTPATIALKGSPTYYSA
jgi:hypothetical protein